jgi:hypothetical protein
MASTSYKGVVHGKTIELDREPGLPDGQKVCVQVQADEAPPMWLEHFTVAPSIAVGKLLIKGTRLQAEDLSGLVDEGRTAANPLQLFYAGHTSEFAVLVFCDNPQSRC